MAVDRMCGAQHVVHGQLLVAEREERGDEVVEGHAGDVRCGGAQQARVRPHESVGANGRQKVQQHVSGGGQRR